MKPKMKITRDALERLEAFVSDTPSAPDGPHLVDNDFASYRMETLSPQTLQRLDAHLDSCPECSEAMETFLEHGCGWHNAEGLKRLTAFQERLLTSIRRQSPGSGTLDTGQETEDSRSLFERIKQGLASLVLFEHLGLRPAVAASGARVEAGIGNLLQSRVNEDTEGNLTVRIGSHVMELNGKRVRLVSRPLNRELVLKQVAPDQVGATCKITRAEREQLPADAKLRIEVVS